MTITEVDNGWTVGWIDPLLAAEYDRKRSSGQFFYNDDRPATTGTLVFETKEDLQEYVKNFWGI